MSDPNEIVGHKTFCENGQYRHEAMTRAEADALWAGVEREDARRKALIPDEDAAIRLFFDAWLRLKEFGWREACYCPKDGRPFDVIEAGSTGIHPCYYDGEWPTGYYMAGEGMDVGPSRPVLFREKCQTCKGRGEIGGHVGQTPEQFDYVTEPCPDCAKAEQPAKGE